MKKIITKISQVKTTYFEKKNFDAYLCLWPERKVLNTKSERVGNKSISDKLPIFLLLSRFAGVKTMVFA